MRCEAHLNRLGALPRRAFMKSYSNLTVVIPTINEGESIGRVVSALVRGYPGIRVVVADDGSSDRTKGIVESMRARNRNVVLLDRSRKSVHGLTASVLDAAMRTRTGKLVVMDGDMQHPPENVARISRALDSYPIVVCVRTRVRGWPAHRMIMSKCMAGVAYAVFRLRHKPTTRDMMSGFFGIRTRILQRMVRGRRSAFVMPGYKVLLDVLRLSPPGTEVAEVPYATFHARKAGKSKLGSRHMLHTLSSTFR